MLDKCVFVLFHVLIYSCSYSMHINCNSHVECKISHLDILRGNVYPTLSNIDEINRLNDKFPDLLAQHTNMLNMIYFFDAGDNKRATDYLKSLLSNTEGRGILKYWKNCSKKLSSNLIHFIENKGVVQSFDDAKTDSEKKPKRTMAKLQERRKKEAKIAEHTDSSCITLKKKYKMQRKHKI